MTQAWQIRPFCVGDEAALRKVFHASVHGLAHPFYTPAQLQAAQVLEAYLDVFTHHYLQAKHQLPVAADDATHLRLRSVLQRTAA